MRRGPLLQIASRFEKRLPVEAVIAVHRRSAASLPGRQACLDGLLHLPLEAGPVHHPAFGLFGRQTEFTLVCLALPADSRFRPGGLSRKGLLRAF